MKSIDDFPHWAIKVIATIILFLLSMIFGAIPLKLSRDENQQRSSIRNLLVSLSNCFAGGVFFSTVILDLLPMVKNTMHKALHLINIQTKFPLSECIVGFGFIMMLIMELFVHSCCGNTWLNHGHAHGTSAGDNEFHAEHDESSHLIHDFHDDEDDDSHQIQFSGGIQQPRLAKKQVSVGATEILHGNSISYDDDDDDEANDTGHGENELERSHRSLKYVQSYETFYSEHGTHHRVKRMYRTKSLASMQSPVHSNFRTYVLVFAISLHSLFEGLAVGLIPEIQLLLQVLVALLIHKSIIAFSIGVQLVDADLPSKVVLICLTIFAAMAPFGVGLGLLVLKSFSKTIGLMFSGILQGIATGTFLYVTFFEVLPHELNIEDNKKPLKILFVLIGYTIINCICYYENRFYKQHTPLHPTTVSHLT